MNYETISMEISSNPEYVSLVRLMVSGIANKMGFSIEEKDDIKVSISEALAKHDLNNPKENGMGIFIIESLMDEVKVYSKDNQGTTIKMTKYLGVDI